MEQIPLYAKTDVSISWKITLSGVDSSNEQSPVMELIPMVEPIPTVEQILVVDPIPIPAHMVATSVTTPEKMEL